MGEFREHPVGYWKYVVPLVLIIIPGIVPAVEDKKHIRFICSNGIRHVFEPLLLQHVYH